MGNTPKEERDYWLYQDQFTSASNWGPGDFERFVEELGIIEEAPEDFFAQRAWRVWDAITEEQRAEFASDFDYWLDQ